MQRMIRAVWMAIRGLARRPSYSVPAIGTVAMGVGVVTTMFGVVYGVVLHPLPYPQPDRLVDVDPARVSGEPSAFSLPDLRDWQEGTRSLAALGAYTTLPSDLVFTGGGAATEMETAYVTSGFFEAMATEPLLGRLPRRDAEEGDNRVVVLSHAAWQQEFGGAPELVGSSVTLNDEAWRVIGVMPPDFAFPRADVDAWVFLSVIPPTSTPFHLRGVRLLQAVGRLVPTVSLTAAEQELGGIASALAAAHPESNEGVVAARLVPLHETVVGDVRTILWILLAASAVVLLAVCANVANLALARESRRAAELAVRTALGAGRGRLVGIVVTESLVVSLTGGLIGLGVALAATRWLTATGADWLPRAGEIELYWPVVLFSLLTAAVVGVAFSLLPGLRAADIGVAGALRRSGRGVTGRGRRSLIAVQAGVAVAIAVGAGLLSRGVQTLARVDPGFAADGLVVAHMTLPSARYPDRADFMPRFDELLTAFGAIPGVDEVGSIRYFPMVGGGDQIPWALPGTAADGPARYARLLQMDGRAIEAMGIPLLAGRALESQDGDGERSVAVISAGLAREMSPGGDSPLGRTLLLGDTPVEVVGVVGDVRQDGLNEDPPATVYVPNALSPRRGASFLLRTDGDPSATIRAVRGIVRESDPSQAITVLTAASDIVGGQTTRPRAFAALMAAFGILALMLAAVGVYGVVAFGVATRRREIGIRRAVGATGGGITRLVVSQGMAPVVVGAGLGAAASWAAADVAASVLYGLPPRDPVAFGGALLAVLVVGFFACWIPARRAGATSPTTALASE